jgi:hypothetical protein
MARKTLRPMRPKPLIAILIAIDCLRLESIPTLYNVAAYAGACGVVLEEFQAKGKAF